MAGSLEKSAEVMKYMQQLIKLPEIQATMQEMSKEMMKVNCTLKIELILIGKVMIQVEVVFYTNSESGVNEFRLTTGVRNNSDAVCVKITIQSHLISSKSYSSNYHCWCSQVISILFRLESLKKWWRIHLRGWKTMTWKKLPKKNWTRFCLKWQKVNYCCLKYFHIS